MLDRLIKSELFFQERRRRNEGRPSADPSDPDAHNRHFGTSLPPKLPETTAWWKNQQRDLFAATDAAELGSMQTMTTITHNDSTPELIDIVCCVPEHANKYLS